MKSIPAILLSIPLSMLSSWCMANETAPLLPLQQAISEAVQNNLGLQIGQFDRSIREQDVVIAEAFFDSRIFGQISTREEEQDFTQSRSENQRVSAGISKTLETGTEISLQSNYGRNDGNRFDSSLNQIIGGNLSHNSSLTLTVRQSLLRGYGRSANLAGVHKAEAQLEIARTEYVNLILDVITQTEKAYWLLAFQQSRLELTRSALQLAESLYEETRQRDAVGLATRLDLLQAQANLANQRETLIDVEREVQEAQDSLLLALGRLDSDSIDVGIKASELGLLNDELPSPHRVWGDALESDLNRRIQLIRMESLGYDRLLAKDRAKSQLDLVLSGSSSGLSRDSASDSFSGVAERQGNDWGVALEFSVPIGKRSAKAQLRQVDLAAEREIVRLSQIEQALFQEARTRWRAVSSGREKLEAVRTTLALEREAFRQAQARYSSGLATFRDVQQAQDALNRALISELNAWLQALQSETDLNRIDGSLLRKHQINLQFL
jgi:outer membrane protein